MSGQFHPAGCENWGARMRDFSTGHRKSPAGFDRVLMAVTATFLSLAATSAIAQNAPAKSPADLANDQCRRFGPFPTQADARAAMTALTPLTKRIRVREEHATQTRGYWVYLPAMPTREQALATARALAAKSVHDYYVVTAGDQQNTISLGLFRDQGNAERRRAEIAALGFSPKVNTRTEDLPVYWLDFALAGAEPPDLASRVAGAHEAHLEATRCQAY